MDDRLLQTTAEHAARVVAPDLLTAFRGVMQVDHKRDRHDPVTEYDRNAEITIRELIFQTVPDSTFMGEEGGVTGAGRVRWFVDPIDGTSNFASGIAFWCTSVAAVIGDNVVAAAIYDPVADHMFTASQNGAWLNDRPLRSTGASAEPNATLICGYPVTRDFRLDGKDVSLARFGRLVETVATLRRPGSAALSIAHAAAGWVDAAAGFGANAWDVAAAILILEKSGGTYLPYSLGKCMSNAPAWEHPGYIALRGGAHYPTLEKIASEISVQRCMQADLLKTCG